MNTTPPSPGPPRKRRRVVLIAGVLLAAALGICVWIFVSSSDSDLTWLTPQQIAAETSPKPFQKLREKLRVWSRPLVDWYRGKQTVLIIDLKVMNLSAALEKDLALGPPATTNSDGLQAWILNAADMAALQKRLTNNPGASIRYAPHFQTIDGRRAELHSGQLMPFGGTYVPVGIHIDLIPKAKRDSINLTLATTSTEVTGSTTNGVSIGTNFFAACRVWVPNSGGLVIQCPHTTGGSGSNYWLIVRPEIFTPPPGTQNPATGWPTTIDLGK